jgi:methyl-accepting chemotaxis protein
MNLTRLSIKLKFSLTLLLAVLLTSSVVGVISHNNATNMLIDNMQGQVLPNILKRIRNQVDKEISLMQAAAQQLAEDPIVLEWLNKGTLKDNESLLVEMLAKINKQYNLTNASFADRQTHRYWNQDGFLRVMADDRDQWFFNFIASNKTYSKSLYTEEGMTKLFVNHQQVNGRGLSGVAKSVNDIVDMLNTNKIEQTGFVFLVDNAGMVKIHKDAQKLDKTDIRRLYGNEANARLINQQPFALIKATVEGESVLLASSYIQSADWYVIAQVREDEILAKISSAANQTIFTIIIALVVMGSLSFVLAGTITKPIDSLAKEFARLGQADGDLSIRLESQHSPELHRLQSGFNNFVEKILVTVRQLASVSESLRSEAHAVSRSAEKSLASGQTQSSRTTELATAIHQMSAAITEVAQNASQASQTADSLEATIGKGRQVVDDTKATITELSTDISAASLVVKDLADKTKSIGSVLDVIRSISEQTNLLALNAAIEAARAGEQGRGFAVVADEVRVLAKRTSDSTDQIQENINRLRIEATNAVEAMQKSETKTHCGAESAEQSQQTLISVVDDVSNMRDLNIQVATSTEEQVAVSNDINKNITQIQDQTNLNLTESDNMAEASQRMSVLANQLEQLVQSFGKRS